MNDLARNDPAAEFQHLLNLRENAAYRAVSVIKTVRDFWEAQDFDSVKAALDRALADYEKAEAVLAHFKKKNHKLCSGENHGNRDAA